MQEVLMHFEPILGPDGEFVRLTILVNCVVDVSNTCSKVKLPCLGPFAIEYVFDIIHTCL